MNNERWMLPEGVDEFLPGDAKVLEDLRQRLLSLFNTWGYDLVVPPLVEYIESLLTGKGNDLDIQTYKLIDQSNGRMMGIRADMTPQVARIDAHKIAKDSPTRLCYIGTVLQTRPRHSDFTRSRSIKQIGAELYGHAGFESDLEIISLMLTTIGLLGVTDLYLDLGHVGIYRGLVNQAGLDEETEQALFDALQRKAVTDVKLILDRVESSSDVKQMLLALSGLHGDLDVLAMAENQLAAADESVQQALSTLRQIAQHIKNQFPAIELHFDLTELRGYYYHTGVVFAAYADGEAQAVAQGGRYDNIGETFGRARAATGFSADLRVLIKLDKHAADLRPGIYAPGPQDEVQLTIIQSLRDSGERVVCELPGQTGDARSLDCDRILIKSKDDDWIVTDVGDSNG